MTRTTATLNDDAGGPAGPAVVECLVQVMDTARLLERPRRASLVEVDEVVLGRGEPAGFARRGRALHVSLPSSSVSSTHARLRRGDDGWLLADERSKNGTWVNGERVQRRLLKPRDLVEVGTALFLVGPGSGDLASGDWERRPEGLRTLSPALERSFALLERLAPASLPVMLLGETGTGKEVAARALHRLSGRSGSFTAMNCGGLPETLLASELFGARKGAYSGAHADRLGLVQEAHRGTLFLDEIAELPAGAQAVLLRVVQEREVTPLGATRPQPVDVRVVAATNEDLAEHVVVRKFRKDLYARLSGATITLPPLRERREDLGLLVAELLPRLAGERAGRLTLHRPAARALLAHDWPMNIRELVHALAAAVAVAGGDEIRLEHLPATISDPAGAGATGGRQREELLGLCAEHEGNVSAIARALQTSRSHVRRLAERLGVDLEKHRG